MARDLEDLRASALGWLNDHPVHVAPLRALQAQGIRQLRARFEAFCQDLARFCEALATRDGGLTDRQVLVGLEANRLQKAVHEVLCVDWPAMLWWRYRRIRFELIADEVIDTLTRFLIASNGASMA